jgi:hypothetical protein
MIRSEATIHTGTPTSADCHHPTNTRALKSDASQIVVFRLSASRLIRIGRM